VLPRTGAVRWYVDYRDQPDARCARQFTTKSAAIAFETKARGEIVVGTHVADSASITVTAAADIWLAACEANGLEESTTRAYRNQVQHHIKPLLGDIRLSRLSAPVGQDFVERLAKDRARPTVIKVVVSPKSIVSEAVRRSLAATNAVREMRMPGSSRDEEPAAFPTMDEIKLLLARAAGYLRPFIHTCIFTGLYPSKARGLRWGDVDLKDAELRVRQRADRLNNIGRPKSKAGRRDIPLGPHMLAVLREWKIAQPKEQRAGGFVFPDAAGGVEDHTTVYRRFSALQIACGISEPRLGPDSKPVLNKGGRPRRRQKDGPHAMRHACASLLIAEGWQAKRIQAYMGQRRSGQFRRLGAVASHSAGRPRHRFIATQACRTALNSSGCSR
jgi:integrase